MHAHGRLREHGHCTKTEEPTLLLRPHLRTATVHRQHELVQYALGGADEALATRQAVIKHQRLESPQVNQRHTGCPPALAKPHPRPSTGQCPCVHRHLRTINGPRPSLPPPAPQCAQQHTAQPYLRTRARPRRHAWPTTPLRPKRGTAAPAEHTVTQAPAPNNPPRDRSPRAATNTWRAKPRRTCIFALTAPGREPVPKRGPEPGPKIGSQKMTPDSWGYGS